MAGRFPQVEFFIGDRSLMVPANFLTSFIYEDTVAMAGDSWTIEFVDQTWKVLESDLIPSLAQNQSKAVSFRFGWGQDKMSQLRYGTVTEYIPAEITRGGIRIQLKGFDTASGKVPSQEKVEKVYQGKISEVVGQIASRNGWAVDIEETVEIQELEGREKGKKPKKWRQGAVPDLVFINELAQRAKSSSGGGAYRVYLEATKDPPVLHFHRDRGQEHPLHREYVVQTDNMGEVIVFSPQVEGSAVVAMGASKTTLVSRDPNTRKLSEKTVAPETFKEGVAVGSKSMVDGSAEVRQVIPPATEEEAQARVDSYYEALSWASAKANLEVVGDPFLVPGRYISVVVKTPANLKYFISGIYLIERVTHTINPGNYTSQMVLIKNAYDVGNIPLKKGVVQRGQ